MSGLLRLIFAVYFLAATAATSHDFHGGIPESSNTSQRIEADSPQAPSSEDLKTFLELLNQREKVLQAANASLLKEADYSYVKITAFMIKAALDGYYAAGLVQKAGEAGVTVVAQTTLQAWIKSGGLNRMKSIGFDVSLLGLSAASSSALTETYRWQYAVPILGTAYAAYLWSDKLMSASDIIEKNGKEIYRIRKEKFRIRQALGS